MPDVSTAELGRILGVSHTAIRKAVVSQRITQKGADEKGRPIFDSEKAMSEWSANSNPGKKRDHKLGGRPSKDGTPAKPRKLIAGGQVSKPDPLNPMRPMGHGGALKTGGELRAPNMPDDDGGGDPPEDDANAPNYNRAAALEKFYKAKLAKLAYEEKAGTLVRIEAVAQIVEREYGRVRTRLLAIPSKLAADVALSDDVNVCRSLIDAAVTDALSELVADAAAQEPGALKVEDDTGD